VTTFALRFLGVSNSQDSPLGCSAAVLEQDGQPLLLIDAGPGSLQRYHAWYGKMPEAIYLTHGHWDHIGDIEPLFYSAYFQQPRQLVRIYVPTLAIPFIHQRLASQPSQLAEGGANFWDAFQLVPVQDSFWHAGLQFYLYAMRHHQPGFCHSLHLPGQFFYSGDTRPVPEIIQHVCLQNEIIFHDARLHGNPSHSGIDDIEREYEKAFCQRMVIYHYMNEDEAVALRARGFAVAEAGQQFFLPAND
jgi:ribonuclease BN (tRNA processing enzyme)